MSIILTSRPWFMTIITTFFIFINLNVFSQSGEKWSVGGNTVNGSSFIGTINNYPLIFKINNVQQMTLTPAGFLGLGTTAPSVMFEVTGDGKVNNFNVLTNLNVGSTLSVLKIFSPTGIVDFDGSNLTTTASFTGNHIYFTGPNKHITSSTGTVDFDGNNLNTTAMFTGGTIYFTALNKHITSATGTVDFDGNNLSTTANIMANKFISTGFANSGNGIVLFDNAGKFQRLQFNNDPSSYLRGDGTFGSLSGTSTWDTIYANAIIGGYVNATKSIQLDGSITAGSRGTGTIGEYSIVVGGPEPAYGYTTSPIASGKYSVSFGTANESSNFGSMSFGGGNVSSGLFSFAIGGSNSSSGNMSVAIGSNNTVSGSNSTVIGKNNTVAGQQSSIIGGMGNTLTIDAINSAIIGGTGITGTQPNTAYVPNLFSNGNVGIGVENPIEKLDVNGNANIRGYLYVQDGVIIGKRIDGQRVNSDTIDVKQLAIKYATTDSLLSLKLETEKMAVSKDINVGEKGKFGNNIIIDGPNSSISTTNSTLYFQGTNVYNDMGFYANKFSTQNGNVIIDGASGSLTASGNITANTMNISKINVDSSVVNSMQVVDELKIGSNSLHLSSSDIPNGDGTNIYSTNGNLKLQSINGNTFHTIINGGANNTGNVGIGTSDPQASLHIKGTDITKPLLTLEGSGTAIMLFYKNGLTQSSTNPVGLLGFGNPATNDFLFDNFPGNILMNNWGNVGIGTNTPYKKLTVNGDVSFANYNISGSGNSGDGFSGLEILGNNQVPTRRGISLDPDPNGYLNFYINSNQNPSGFNFKNGNGNTTLLAIQQDGYVGIGTSTPTATLHVNGTLTLDIGAHSNGDILTFDNASGNAIWINPNLLFSEKWQQVSGTNEIIYNAGNVSIDENDLLLRNSHHGLGWYGTKWDNSHKYFNNVNVDGPVLYGFSGGALGSKYFDVSGGSDIENIALRWTKEGKVGIGTNTPYKKLTVNGDVSFANYNLTTTGNPGDGYSGFEILGNDQIPTRRGISLDPDPNGYLNFYINSNQNPSGFNFKNGNGNNTLLTINYNGNVGIGTTTPDATLHIKETGTFQIGPFEFSQDGCASVGCTLAPRLRIIRKSSGSITDDVVEFVAAGPSNEFNMHLRGKIFSKEIELLANIPWPDYVFNNNYKLKSLEEIEKYIKQNKHLPEVPSAEDINENGIKIGEMNTILLKKIEELTLYSIEQNKRLKALEEEIAKLQTK